jgi:uncharacterized protein DUF559
VSAEACGQPLSLAHIPIDQVVRLVGLNDDQLAVSLDPLPVGSPVVICHRIPHPAPSAHDVVADVLMKLESIAMDLFPAWLPSADAIDSSSDFDRRVVRRLAHRRAAESPHFGPFLADMAEAALRGRAPDRRLGPEVRANGLTRIIADTHRRHGVVLRIGPGDGSSTEDEQRRVAVALEWLVNHGVGVWLSAGALPLVDRYATWQLSVPGYLDALSRNDSTETPPPVDYPALAGLPHPAGAAERCVVEIDGSDHRGILKYAADRRRDNGLMLDGFAVLRFTNDEIVDDPAAVLAVIESLLVKKRHDEGNLL